MQVQSPKFGDEEGRAEGKVIPAKADIWCMYIPRGGFDRGSWWQAIIDVIEVRTSTGTCGGLPFKWPNAGL